MTTSQFQQQGSNGLLSARGLIATGSRMPRQLLIGIILILALLAFEIFNFDTTRFALENLFGDIRFAGLAWATILAVAFCAIDFAGLARLFTPQRGLDEPKEIWYLTGAWLLGATMNAVMTWWAVSVVIIDHQLGNEVLSREQLVDIVPVFVAVLVWLTRILFIGAVTLAGEHLLHEHRTAAGRSNGTSLHTLPTQGQKPVSGKVSPKPKFVGAKQGGGHVDLATATPVSGSQPTRVNRRPPRPAFTGSNLANQNGPRYSGRSRR